MKPPVPGTTLPQRLTRSTLLLVLAAAIIGIGCATIRVPAPKDETGETIYLPAAKRGDGSSQFQLALAYRYGSAGLPQDNAQAAVWLEKAASGGHVPAQLAWGDALIGGDLGQNKQPAEGLAWLRKAADSGSADAQFHLAALLESGAGVPANPAEAAALYEKAARAGRKFAAWRLARMFERGAGTRPNPVDAYAWYRIADGEADADRLRRRLKPAEAANAEQRFAALNREVAR
jgi:TPR repeat protein